MTLHELTVQTLTTSDFSELQLLEEGDDMQDVTSKRTKQKRTRDKFNDSGSLTPNQIYRYRQEILKKYKRKCKVSTDEQYLDHILFDTFCEVIKDNNLSTLQIRQILEQEVHANKKDTRLEILKRLITEITLNDLLNTRGELEDEVNDLASLIEG